MENLNIGHQVSEGYPYDGVESKRFFVQRPLLYIGQDGDEKGKVCLEVNTDHFTVPQEGLGTPFADFCLHRLIEFQEALKMSEEQINDMLTEDPVIPENYGFEVMHENKEITDPPICVYVSKFDENVTLFRKPGDINDKNWNPAMWTILKKEVSDGSTTFKEIELNLPSARIAFAAFYALGIKVMEDESEKPNNNVSHQVQFNRDETEASVFVNAESDEDAIEKAKIVFETDEDYPIKDVLIDELKVVKRF